MARYLGVDGCPAGWLAVFEESNHLAYAIHGTFSELVNAHHNDAIIFVDIPIGLPSRNRPRECDALARRMLGSRACTVFSPPARATLAANDYPHALALNRTELGRGISKQAFALRDKILEVDHLLRHKVRLRARVFEMHPEVAFWRLNGHAPLMHGKKTADGYARRLALLQAREPQARHFVEHVVAETLRREVQRDDIVDAIAGLILARRGVGDVLSLTGGHTRDSEGLPMRICY